MRKRTLLLAVGLGLVAVLPILDHADQATCCTATSSLASTVNDPVAGDEAFFSQPGGPSNVMFLLDVSGSMAQLPQCGDEKWGTPGNRSARPTCRSPSFTLARPTDSNTSPTYTVTGTCTPHSSGLTTTTSDLGWMEAVKPQTAYADAGRTNSLLWDCPPWGNGGAGCATKCSGNGCLFDPNAYYTYGDWSAKDNATNARWPTATRRQLDSVALPGTTKEPTAPCVALDENGNVIVDRISNKPADLGDDCRACMKTRGFFIYKINYFDSAGDPQSVTAPLFKGTFLNANPPKFVTARQVLKANAWMDPDHPKAQDQIRLGLAITDSNVDWWVRRRAQLIVPLGPDKGDPLNPDKGGAYPATQAKFRQARQYLLSVLNYDQKKYEDPPDNVICDGSATGFSSGFFNPADGATPLASALFNVGQYFTANAPNTDSLYDQVFGAGYMTDEFSERYAGRTNAPWVTDTTKTKCSICWECQASSIVLITDGSPNREIDFPDSLRTYDDAGYGLASNCAGTYPAGDRVPWTDTTFRCTSPSDGGKASGLPRVADWLHTKAASTKKAPDGLRYDLALTGEKDALRISTIGINLTDPAAKNILDATATLGKGVFVNASDPDTLARAVATAVNLVTPKQLSFSAGSSSALQNVQTSAAQAFITRFRPTDQHAWEGHVIEAFLFDEFLNGCDPAKAIQPKVACGQGTNQVSADLDGNGRCDATFLIDLDCDRIVEDAKTGAFLKLGTTTPARLAWDAGQLLSFETLPGGASNDAYRSAKEDHARPRRIFTWIGDARVDFTRDNAAKLLPYLNVSAAWCTSFLKGIRVDGGANAPLECAKQIISYVRGWDVLDQDHDGCAGPNNPSNKSTCQRGTDGEERDRPMDPAYGTSAIPSFWKLGDIVHSSPAVLTAPIDPIRCDTGYEPQCTWAIRSPGGVPDQTPMDGSCTNRDCYQDYRKTHIDRPRVLLVGANDGMLHAFDAGKALTSGKPDLTGRFPYDNGTGEELWAFIPPDMLPRLKDLLSGHRYMVDGSVMLRDVWVDGSSVSDGATTPAAPTGQDGTKQATEFHTVAVFGRRAGGNQYTALDVTNPLKPTLLWSFPRTGSDDARFMGESWNAFTPRTPPIFPVRLAATSTSPRSDRTRGFSERWVVMFGGGYDPTLTLGRAVFMLDVWSGGTVWRFTHEDFKATLAFTGASAPSMFPVPSGVAPLDVGKVNTPTLDVDGFFDTATWGDLGGNLFVARFHDPGVIGTTGRVGNWYAARAFEQLRREDDAQYVSDASGAGRNEFFHMTANAFDPGTRTLRTYLGSGNREQLMRPSSAWCGTDNLLGCCQAGCTSVMATTAENDGACSHADTFSCVDGLLGHTSTNTCPEDGTTCAASPADLYTRSVDLSWTCPDAGTTHASGSATFDGSGLGSVAAVGRVSTTSASLAAPTHNRFYGIVSYGGKRTFADAATAKAFDRNRLTDVAYAGSCAGGSCTLVNTTQASVTYDTSTFAVASTTCLDRSRKCSATASDPGWFYEYGDVCPLASCSGMSLPWLDEKTGAGANVILGCVAWSGFRPFGVTTTATDPCSGPVGTPSAYDYSVNYLSGTPSYACNGGTPYIASQRSVTGAPTVPGGHVDILDDGRIQYSVERLGDSGRKGGDSISQSLGTRSAAGAPIYWLQVPQQLHSCRHVKRDDCN